MTYIIIALVAVIVVVSLIAYFLTKAYKKYKRAYEEEHNKLIGLEQEYSTLVEAYKVKKENKEKSDEKINDLDSGIVSADDILPKRKSRT